jgi:hypothetical protein
MGKRFDQQAFHDDILEQGMLPIRMLTRTVPDHFLPSRSGYRESSSTSYRSNMTISNAAEALTPSNPSEAGFHEDEGRRRACKAAPRTV